MIQRMKGFPDNKLKTHQEEKNPKLNSLINNINTSSTFLASGGTSYFINQAAEKGLKTAEHYTNDKIIKKYINKNHAEVRSPQQITTENTTNTAYNDAQAEQQKA